MPLVTNETTDALQRDTALDQYRAGRETARYEIDSGQTMRSVYELQVQDADWVLGYLTEWKASERRGMP